MEAPERVRLMDGIASKLANVGWSRIDLHLAEFGFPTQPSWNGEPQGYILEMLRQAGPTANGRLRLLAETVGVMFTPPSAPSDPPAFWCSRLFRVFISHLAQDKKMASEVKAALKDLGISGFLAHEDIEPTREWQVEIETALDTMEALVALLTPSFHDSKWTDQEIGFALGRGVPVIAVRLGLDPYGFIGKIQAFQGHNKLPSQIAREIHEKLCRSTLVGDRVIDATVVRFEEADSFKSANSTIKLLQHLPITIEQVERLERAVEANPQCKSAFDVPGVLRAIVKKVRPSTDEEEASEFVSF